MINCFNRKGVNIFSQQINYLPMNSMQTEKYDVLIIGAGVHGLSTAFYLSKLQLKIAILDQFTIGHNLGSSHGKSRIIRCTYQKDFFRDLAIKSKKISWPYMQKILGIKLIESNPFCYFDSTQSYDKYASVAKNDNQNNLQFIEYEQLKKKYKTIPIISETKTPIVDHTGGAILAQKYINGLHQYLLACQNVTIYQHVKVKSVSSNHNSVTLQTSQDLIFADKVLIASSKATADLFPQLSELMTPIKQKVLYAKVKDWKKYIIGAYPSWAYKNEYGIFYSLPSIQKSGLKFAEHVTSNKYEQELKEQEKFKMLEFLFKTYIGQDLIGITKRQECIYTMTKTQDFIIDWVDDEERILVCCACSGHSFKFAPLLGKIISQVVIDDESQEELFQKNRYLFRIAYHKGVNLHG